MKHSLRNIVVWLVPVMTSPVGWAQEAVLPIAIPNPATMVLRSQTIMDTVKQKAKEAGIQYPVAVDNDRQNWDAWHNRMAQRLPHRQTGVCPLLVVRRT